MTKQKMVKEFFKITDEFNWLSQELFKITDEKIVPNGCLFVYLQTYCHGYRQMIDKVLKNYDITAKNTPKWKLQYYLNDIYENAEKTSLDKK